MSGRKVERILLGQFQQGFIGCSVPDQAFIGSLTKCYGKFSHGDRGNHYLVNVFNGFDEMRLAQDKIEPVRVFDFYGGDFHKTLHGRNFDVFYKLKKNIRVKIKLDLYGRF